MAERKPIFIEPESDTARLLRQVGDEPVSIVSEGVKYRIEREPADPFANYDAAKVLASLRGGIGLYEGSMSSSSSKISGNSAPRTARDRPRNR